MIVKQVKLQRGNTFMVTWVDKVDQLSEGCQVTLNGSDDVWTVKKIYDKVREHTEIDQRWNVDGAVYIEVFSQ